MTKKDWIFVAAAAWLLLLGIFWSTKSFGYNGFLIASIIAGIAVFFVYRYYKRKKLKVQIDDSTLINIKK